MITLLLYCRELPQRKKDAKAHLAEREVPDVHFFEGIHAEKFGILAWRPDRRDYPLQGYCIPMSQVGLSLSHHMAWMAFSLMSDDTLFVLEDDCDFTPDWKPRLDQFMRDLPTDWDIAMPGNSNCSDKPRQHVKGDVYKVQWPFCTHAYMVRRKALPVLLAIRDAATKVDIALMQQAYPKLQVFAMLPRCVHQRGTDLMA